MFLLKYSPGYISLFLLSLNGAVVLMFLLTFMMQNGRTSAKQKEKIMVWPSVETEQISKRKTVDNQWETILFSSRIFYKYFVAAEISDQD